MAASTARKALTLALAAFHCGSISAQDAIATNSGCTTPTASTSVVGLEDFALPATDYTITFSYTFSTDTATTDILEVFHVGTAASAADNTVAEEFYLEVQAADSESGALRLDVLGETCTATVTVADDATEITAVITVDDNVARLNVTGSDKDTCTVAITTETAIDAAAVYNTDATEFAGGEFCDVVISELADETDADETDEDETDADETDEDETEVADTPAPEDAAGSAKSVGVAGVVGALVAYYAASF